jgi:hypothetical protein
MSSSDPWRARRKATLNRKEYPMDGLMIVFGLIIWFFAVVGLLMGGKGFLRWIANHPEGFRRSLGLDAEGSAKPSRLEEAMAAR